MKEEERKLGHEVKALDNMLIRNFMFHARKAGIDEVTVMHGWIVGYIYENEGIKDIYQKDVETAFSINRSTVTNIVKLMEKKGYIRRESVQGDARLKRLKLTEEGVKIHQRTMKVIEEIDTKTLEGISAEEMNTFFRTIDRLKENIERQRGE